MKVQKILLSYVAINQVIVEVRKMHKRYYKNEVEVNHYLEEKNILRSSLVIDLFEKNFDWVHYSVKGIRVKEIWEAYNLVGKSLVIISSVNANINLKEVEVVKSDEVSYENRTLPSYLDGEVNSEMVMNRVVIIFVHVQNIMIGILINVELVQDVLQIVQVNGWVGRIILKDFRVVYILNDVDVENV